MKPVGVILALDNKGMMLANAAKQNNSAGLEQQAKSAPANAEQAERAEPVMTRPPIWRSWGAQGCPGIQRPPAGTTNCFITTKAAPVGSIWVPVGSALFDVVHKIL